MDIVGEAISAMRSGEPKAARALLRPPWGLRYTGLGGAGVHVVLAGSAWLLPPSAGEPIQLHAGDVVLVRREQPHGLADDPRTALHELAAGPEHPMVAWPSGATALGDADGSVLIGGTYSLENDVRAHPLLRTLPDVVHLRGAAKPTTTIRAVVDLLSDEMDAERPGRSAGIPALLDLLLVHTMRAWIDDEARIGGWVDALRDPATVAALRAIHERPSEPWTVTTLGFEAGLSRAAFARRFMTLTGQTPIDYLTWSRMTLAGRLLVSSDAKLEAVADRVGYSSAYAFGKAFKREFGLPPAQYRQQRRAAAAALASA